MSSISVKTITDASGGSTTSINGFTPSVSNMAGRNRIINGDMRIDQRNAGAAVTGNDTVFGVDRFSIYAWVNGTGTIQRNAGGVTPPVGFSNYLGFTSSGATTLTSSQAVAIQHRIEGYNVADLGFGSSGAATVTLSFWVRSSLSGIFGGSLQNNAGNRSYPFSYTINAANTWEQKAITIAGDISGTWAKDNTEGLRVYFSLGAGSSFSGSAGAWVGSGLTSTTGATSVVGTSGATFYITGVQLEEGSVATPFEHRQYGQELALCQRYYEEVNSPSVDLFLYPINTDNSGGYRRLAILYKVNKRVPPTVTPTWYLNPGSSRGVNGVTTDMCDIYVGGAGASEYASLYKITMLAEL